MYLSALAFVAGVLTLPWFATIPPLIWFLPLFIVIGLLWYFSPSFYKTIFKLLWIALLGCLFVLLHSQHVLRWQLPENLETKTITVIGKIATLPKVEGDTVQFELMMDSLYLGSVDNSTMPCINPRFSVLRCSHTKTYAPLRCSKIKCFCGGLANCKQTLLDLRELVTGSKGVLIQLAWYHYDALAPLHVGDRWQLQVRLKRPHTLLNPGGFDYEKWLFSRGIRATGYVTEPGRAKLLETSHWHYSIDHLREYLQQKIQILLQEESTAGLITALVMGAQNGITQKQWQVMRATGTNHLMAIAGVHIAFVSGFIYALVNFLWRRSSGLMLMLPTPQAAGCGALLAAVIYSALAGFALPTQRALVMLLVFMSGLFLRRELNPWNAFVLALLLIVVWEPLETLSISFWLSFAAVFAIIYGITGRDHRPRQANFSSLVTQEPESLWSVRWTNAIANLWWKYGRIQWVITLALMPVTLVLFQQSSLISFAANLIAVPAVGILVLPLCLSGALLAIIFPFAGQWILWLAAKNIAGIWWILAWLGNLPGAVWQQHVPNAFVLVAALVGILLLIAPRGFPARGLGLFWLFPLVFFHPKLTPFGSMRLSLLDVGQGLSAVIQTQYHTLVFDTGPPMGKQDDAGGRVVLPYLRSIGVSKLDTLVISHGDSDHIGGAFTLLKEMPVKQILTSVPERFSTRKAITCQAGQHWEWDGVDFQMLYPPAELLGQNNNSSCVLRAKTQNGSILLTGDIEKPAETYLVAHAASLLPANVLVAPHHGSRTSSTPDFVRVVHPDYVLFPTGYKNRYHFPSDIVVKRYQQTGAVLFESPQNGAIMVEMGGTEPLKITTQRALERAVWREVYSPVVVLKGVNHVHKHL